MASKKLKGLGRGLEALLGPAAPGEVSFPYNDASSTSPGLPASLLLTDMVPGRYQPRTRMDEGALYELAESIKAQGIMQPLLVRRLEEQDGLNRIHDLKVGGTDSGPAERHGRPVYEIIAGGRRFRAARRGWPGWTACQCWYARSVMKPPPRWR